MKYLVFFLLLNTNSVFSNSCQSELYELKINTSLKNAHDRHSKIINSEKFTNQVRENLISSFSLDSTAYWDKSCNFEVKISKDQIQSYLNRLNGTHGIFTSTILNKANIPFLLSYGYLTTKSAYDLSFLRGVSDGIEDYIFNKKNINKISPKLSRIQKAKYLREFISLNVDKQMTGVSQRLSSIKINKFLLKKIFILELASLLSVKTHNGQFDQCRELGLELKKNISNYVLFYQERHAKELCSLMSPMSHNTSQFPPNCRIDSYLNSIVNYDTILQTTLKQLKDWILSDISKHEYGPGCSKLRLIREVPRDNLIHTIPRVPSTIKK